MLTRWERIVLLALTGMLVAVTAFAGTSPWSRVTQSTYCQTVTTSPVTILARDITRVRWSIWTTSGAATIYFREDGTATAPAGESSLASGPLVGGQSYTEDEAAVTSAVSVITKSGSAWVCAKAAVNP